MSERTRPEPAATSDGKTLLRITRADCDAFGRPPVAFTLDLTGLDLFLVTALEGPPSPTYVILQGPPGGPLAAQVIARDGEGDDELAALIRRHAHASSPEVIELGAAVDVVVAGRTRRALPFATNDGPSWRLAPGGCALSLGPVVILLEAEGFDLSCEQVLAHPDLGRVVQGFHLDENPGDSS